jgi:hypothetical protein
MSGRTINVTNATELTRAIRTAIAGDNILLAPGNYGSVLVNSRNPSGTVTIRSANPDADAMFDSLVVSRSSNFTFNDIDVSRIISSPAMADFGAAVRVQFSNSITFVGIDVHGSLNNNPNDDGNGLLSTQSNRIAVLDSTFRDLNNAVVLGRATDVIFAGNTINGTREGLNLAQVDGALVERNFFTNIVPDMTRGDHGDAIQLHSNGAAGVSNDVTIRGNVIKTTAGTHGIYLNNEKAALGVVHTNIVVDNNYYEGNARHGITVNAAENVTITNNTLRDIGYGGWVPAINVWNVRNGLVEDNIAPLLIGTAARSNNTNVTWANNIDLWDRQFRVGVSDSSLFSTPTESRNLDFSSLEVRSGTMAAARGIGFDAVSDIGDIKAGSAAVLAAYLPQFDALTPHIVMV